jgi:hypothetical protein
MTVHPTDHAGLGGRIGRRAPPPERPRPAVVDQRARATVGDRERRPAGQHVSIDEQPRGNFP